MVAAWQAEMSPHKLIEVLLAVKDMGIDVQPSKNFNEKHWLFLESYPDPEQKVTLELRVLQNYGYDKLVEWLDANGYLRLQQLEQPGDFIIRGDTIIVWTRQLDTIIRFTFDGDIVEQIAKVDPETQKVEVVTTASIINVIKRDSVPVEKVLIHTPPVVEVDVTGVMPTFTTPNVPEPSKRIVRKKDDPRKYPASTVNKLVKSFAKLDKNHPFHSLVKWS
jgi:hypothetical protein